MWKLFITAANIANISSAGIERDLIQIAVEFMVDHLIVNLIKATALKAEDTVVVASVVEVQVANSKSSCFGQ